MERKIILWSILFLALPGDVMAMASTAQEDGAYFQGRASFSGQVMASACTLAMDDTWQIIDMGTTPIRDMQKNVSGPEKIFSLQLQNCHLTRTGNNSSPYSYMQIAFDGLPGEKPDQFGLIGQAKGVELKIHDSKGSSAQAGRTLPPDILSGNDQYFNYTLQLVHNNEPLQAGDYYSIVRLKVNYE